MARLNKIIKEVLSTKKKKDCNCGCGGCAKKSPTLTENKVKEFITEGLQYHITNNISLFESVYRIGSEKHLDLINEARALWVRGLMDVSEDDQALLETHLGHFGLYEGVEVPLDLPMVNEIKMPSQEEVDKFFSITQNEMHYLNSKPVMGQEGDRVRSEIEPWDEYDLSNWNALVRKAKAQGKINEEVNNSDLDNAVYRLENVLKYLDIEYKETRRGEKYVQINYIPVTSPQSQNPEFVNVRYNNDEDLEIIKNRLDLPMLNENNLFNQTNLSPEEHQKAKTLKDWDKRKDDYTWNPDTDLWTKEKKSSLKERINTILEAKKKAKSKKKDPPLNKPERGGSKAYFVYVRDPKTKKIKKVSFGSGGLRAKIKNKEARNAFAARHNCKNKKDRTKAGYWSCNLPRYAEQLGLGSKMNTFW